MTTTRQPFQPQPVDPALNRTKVAYLSETDLFQEMTQEHIDYCRSLIPMGRFPKVEEIAAMVAWMASPQCSFTTGAVFDVTGGRAMY